jgi:hypothetical protein
LRLTARTAGGDPVTTALPMAPVAPNYVKESSRSVIVILLLWHPD